MKEKPLVSIVLPVYNQASSVGGCIDTLISQTYVPKEIVVVNDGSTDETRTRLERFSDNVTIRTIEIVHQGRSIARNIGVRNARGSIIAFAEGDAEYAPTYLEKGVKFFADPRVGGVYVQHQAFRASGWVAEALWLERKILFQGYTPFSAWFYRKDVFLSLNGFDENLDCGEDQDLTIKAQKKGWSIGFEPKVLWWHREPDSFLKLVKRSFWRGKNRIPFLNKHPDRFPLKSFTFTSILLVLILSSMTGKLSVLIVGGYCLVVYVAKVGQLCIKGWNIIQKKRYILLIAFLSIIRGVASSLGLLTGFLAQI